MVLFRALGWLLLAMAVGAVVYDGLVWWSEGVLRLLPLGELWSRLDLDSLNRGPCRMRRIRLALCTAGDDYVVARVNEARDEVRADVTGPADDDNPHCGHMLAYLNQLLKKRMPRCLSFALLPAC